MIPPSKYLPSKILYVNFYDIESRFHVRRKTSQDETDMVNGHVIVAKTSPLDKEAALDTKNDVPTSPWAQTVH